MTQEVVRVREAQGVLTLWLNRPEKRNALNGPMVEALHEALVRAEERPGVKVILLRGRGPDFCAGADLDELERTTRQGPDASLAEAEGLGSLFLRMRRHPLPVIAAVHGRALAGGCGLATACDLIVASETAEFGYPEIHLGFVPAMVMAILRLKIGESRAFELVSLGGRIPASEAMEMGLVNRVFSEEKYEEDLQGFAQDLALRPSEALTLTKHLLYELADLSMGEGIARGAQVNVEARQTQACREGVEAFLQRRKSGST